MFVTILVLTILGGFNPNFALIREKGVGSYVRGWLIRSGICLPFAWAITYFGLPSLVGPFGGLSFLLLMFLWVNALITGMSEDEWVKGNWVVVGFTAIVFATWFFGSSLNRATEYAAVVGEVIRADTAHTLSPADPSHLRMVGEEQADWLADKILGESPDMLGSRFEVGEHTMQRVGNRLYSVAPLEYVSLLKWYSGEGTPGFIMVDAQDPGVTPQLVTSVRGVPLKLRYMPSACFGEDLERHLYSHGYSNWCLEDFQFEVTDDSLPKWVVTLMRPTLGYSGHRVFGILIVDPQTGEIDEYLNGKPIPEWVDRVIPGSNANSWVDWWGTLRGGWWNSWLSEDGTFETTDDNMELVWGTDGRCYWFSGLSSTKESDQALIGYVLMDSHTGKLTRYPGVGGTEKAALEAVNAKVSNFAGWHGTEPVPYFIYGEFVFVCPVVANGQIFQKLAIVWGRSNLKVALGSTKEEALSEFRKLLTAGGNEVDPAQQRDLATLTGVVNRVASDVRGGTQEYYLWIAQRPEKIFSGSSAGNPELPLIQKGDTVVVRYLDTPERVVQISEIDNKAM